MKNNVNILEYIKTLFDKYKYPIIVLGVGLLLVFSDGMFSFEKKPQTVEPVKDTTVERQLTEVLGQIQGVGRVTVALTEQGSSQTVYAKDNKYNNEGEEIVVINDNGSQKPLIEYTLMPAYKGAVVVCDGGGDSRVQLEVTNAVKALTGVSCDNIIILKMKK